MVLVCFSFLVSDVLVVKSIWGKPPHARKFMLGSHNTILIVLDGVAFTHRYHRNRWCARRHIAPCMLMVDGGLEMRSRDKDDH